MKNARVLLLLLLLSPAVMTRASQAQDAVIDYIGFAWEDGRFPNSVPGDKFNLVAVVDNIDPRFGINLNNEEVTLWVTDLISTGQVDQGGGIFSVSYTGGALQLWRDPSMNHLYGSDPPNATAPSTFKNGSLLLGGSLSDFFLFFDISTRSGAYEANVNFDSGSGLGTLGQISATGYTFGGVLDPEASRNQVPNGYDLSIDGVVQVNVQVGVERTTWGAMKELYGRHPRP